MKHFQQSKMSHLSTKIKVHFPVCTAHRQSTLTMTNHTKGKGHGFIPEFPGVPLGILSFPLHWIGSWSLSQLVPPPYRQYTTVLSRSWGLLPNESLQWKSTSESCNICLFQEQSPPTTSGNLFFTCNVTQLL